MLLRLRTLLATRTHYRLLTIAALLLYALIATWIMGHGRLELGSHEHLGMTYVDTWQNLLQWEFHVDRQSIGSEGFIRDGKTYTYFGMFPALVRGPFISLFGTQDSDWSRVSMLLAAMLFAVTTFVGCRGLLSLQGVSGIFYPSVITAALAAGSPVGFLFSKASIYHEASLWALAWTTSGLAILAGAYGDRGFTLRSLTVLSAVTACAMSSRLVTSLGLLLAFSIVVGFLALDTILPRFLKHLAPRYTGRRRLLPLALLPVLASGVFILTVNHYRWGHAFEFLPVHRHVLFKKYPQRLAYFEQIEPLRLGRAALAIDYYLIPRASHLNMSFPFVEFQPERAVGYGPASHNRDPTRLYHDFDWLEPGVPLPVTTPLVVLLALMGLLGLMWYRPPAKAFLIGIPFTVPAVFILFWPGLTLRYGTEFIPLLMIGASMGVGALRRWPVWDRHGWVRAACFLLVVAGVLCTLSAVYAYKLDTWGVSQLDKARLRSLVDRAVSVDR